MKLFNLLVLPSFLLLTACQQMPVEKKLPVVVQKIDNDSDQDGVFDDKDQCLNTSLNVIVDAVGCPKQFILPDVLRMELRVFYGKSQSFPDTKYLTVLATVGKKMQENPNSIINIEGHASKADKNPDVISRERAMIVAQILKEKYGISDNRITINSYGDQRPIADNNTQEGRQMNQRIFGIISIDE